MSQPSSLLVVQTPASVLNKVVRSAVKPLGFGCGTRRMMISCLLLQDATLMHPSVQWMDLIWRLIRGCIICTGAACRWVTDLLRFLMTGVWGLKESLCGNKWTTLFLHPWFCARHKRHESLFDSQLSDCRWCIKIRWLTFYMDSKIIVYKERV